MTVNKEKIISQCMYSPKGFKESLFAHIIQTEDGKFRWEISHHYKPAQNAGFYYPSSVSGDNLRQVEQSLETYANSFTDKFGVKKNIDFTRDIELSGIEYNDQDQDKINELVDWFYKNFQDPAEGGLYYENKEGGFHGDIRGARDELQKKFPNVSSHIIDASVRKIESHGGSLWTPIHDSKELLIDELNTRMDSMPKPKTAPTFDLGSDNLFHIKLPPDNKPVNSQDVSLKKLRETIDALLESFVGANAHQELTPVIEEYRRSISGEQISISQVYWSGIELDNAVQIIKQGIAAKEQPSLPFKTELKLKTALDAHGVYIMLDKEGRRLVEASAAYSQSAKQTQEIKQAIEKLSNTITESRNLLGDDIREHVSSALKDIGQGQHPERSNQSVGNTLTNLVSGVLDWIKRSSTETIVDLVINKTVEGVLGAGLIVAGVVAHNAALLLVNIAPLLLIILAPLAGELTWVASVADILERIRLMINRKK